MKKSLNIILTAIIIPAFYELAIMAYWVFVLGLEDWKGLHKSAWSQDLALMLGAFSVCLLIYGFYTMLFKPEKKKSERYSHPHSVDEWPYDEWYP